MLEEKPGSLDFATLSAGYRSGEFTPAEVLAAVAARIEAYGDPAVFIHLLGSERIAEQLARIEADRGRGVSQPLYGMPFAVKDNVDVAGCPTTAACPGFAYVAERSATVVERLCAAGAILVGKANLDQFATGLVGTRSPYGTPRNPFNADYIPGGSSSGSAVAVAAGLVSFAVGTDTAGSGRVPAAFNNIVGLKPTRGIVSAAGVVPACRSLDCVSLFALTCEDARAALAVARGPDSADPYSRDPAELPKTRPISPGFRFGVPADDQLEFFGNPHVPKLFEQAVRRLEALGGTAVRFDYAPFARAARLLYEGPWLAERLAAIKPFFEAHPEALLDVTRTIIGGASSLTAVSAFEAMYALQAIRQETRRAWEGMDLMLLPTAGTTYTRAQVEAEPYRLNANLGRYTNFVNLLDLCALAVPAGFGGDGLPAGVTLLAPAGQDEALLRIGAAYHRATKLTLGATGKPVPPAGDRVGSGGKNAPAHPPEADKNICPTGGIREIHMAVLGAHLCGQPLNHQLTTLGGRLVRTCRTAACYRFYALAGTTPAKPGLIRLGEGDTGGAAIELEVWALSAESFGTFVAAIPPPLGIGSILLEDGSWVKGFLCEPHALAGARDITAFGGWRAFLKDSDL